MFKPNFAFYIQHGSEGIRALEMTCLMIRQHIPDSVIIIDFKAGDIGNSNMGWIHFAFNICDADAVTINPYMGAFRDVDEMTDGLQPFFDQKDKGIIPVCRTSNKGSETTQKATVKVTDKDLVWFEGDSCEMPYYQLIALLISRKWDTNKNSGLVVGANHPSEMEIVRTLCPEMPILIPAFGAQGGAARESVRAGLDGNFGGIICNNSRGIIFKSSAENFAEAAGQEAKRFHDELVGYINEKKNERSKS